MEALKRKVESREEAPGTPEKKPRVAEPCQQQQQHQAFRNQPFPGTGPAVPRVPPLKVSPAGTGPRPGLPMALSHKGMGLGGTSGGWKGPQGAGRVLMGLEGISGPISSHPVMGRDTLHSYSPAHNPFVLKSCKLKTLKAAHHSHMLMKAGEHQ